MAIPGRILQGPPPEGQFQLPNVARPVRIYPPPSSWFFNISENIPSEASVDFPKVAPDPLISTFQICGISKAGTFCHRSRFPPGNTSLVPFQEKLSTSI